MIIEVLENDIHLEKIEVDNYNLENGGAVYIGRSDECTVFFDKFRVHLRKWTKKGSTNARSHSISGHGDAIINF